MECQDFQLCARLKAGINSAIYRVQDLWDKNATTEGWGLFIVDAKELFNDINRVGIMWMVRHLWTYGAHFVFNCYRHWSLLVIRNGNGTENFLHSKEGETQGDPLKMI